MVQVSILSFIISFLTIYFIIKVVRSGVAVGIDDTATGPQKFHNKPTPRIGGAGIFLGFACGMLLFFIIKHSSFYLLFLLSTLPVFAGGFLEDLTHKVSPKTRLLLALSGGFLVILLLKAYVGYIYFPFLGRLFFPLWFGWIFTIVAVAGVTNSINIIDGYNGLASMVSIMILLGLFYVSYKVNDHRLMEVELILILSIAGFFLWNFPFGLIFMGDGGAYLIGFAIAEISVLLVKNHHEVSVWFPFLLVIYPVFETLFSIYRRKFIKNKKPDLPDAMHLHSLMYRRVVKFLFHDSSPQYKVLQNSLTSPFLWSLSALSTIPAILFWNKPDFLIIFVIIFIIVYLYLYFSIIKFKLGKKSGSSKQ